MVGEIPTVENNVEGVDFKRTDLVSEHSVTSGTIEQLRALGEAALIPTEELTDLTSEARERHLSEGMMSSETASARAKADISALKEKLGATVESDLVGNLDELEDALCNYYASALELEQKPEVETPTE